MCLVVFDVLMSDIPDFSACLVVVDRQDTSELDAEALLFGLVDGMLKHICQSMCPVPLLIAIKTYAGTGCQSVATTGVSRFIC